MEFMNIPDLLTFEKDKKRTSCFTENSVKTCDVNLVDFRDPKDIVGWCKYHNLSHTQCDRIIKGLCGLTINIGDWLLVPKNDKYRFAGTIGLIQEPAGKLRVVAVPILFLQLLLEPEKRKLEYINRSIPEIYTFDQGAGITFAQRSLMNGNNRIFCYDLTAFTDRLPFEIQRKVGDMISLQTHVIQEVCRSSWLAKRSPTSLGDEWKYSTGQPMGLGPSFHLATLTHWCILASLCAKIGYNVNAGKRLPFGINGDDVVITDPQLAQLYETRMSGLGVEINRSKSIISNTHGEFLGHWFNSLGEIVPPAKFRKEATSIPQLVKTIDYYGKRIMKTLPFSREVNVAFKLPFLMGGPKRNIIHSYRSSLAMTVSYLQMHIKRLSGSNVLNHLNSSEVERFLSHIDGLKSAVMKSGMLPLLKEGPGMLLPHIRSKKDIISVSLDDYANHQRGIELMGEYKTKSRIDPFMKLKLFDKVNDLIKDMKYLKEIFLEVISTDDVIAFEELSSECIKTSLNLIKEISYHDNMKLTELKSYDEVIKEANKYSISLYDEFRANTERIAKLQGDDRIRANLVELEKLGAELSMIEARHRVKKLLSDLGSDQPLPTTYDRSSLVDSAKGVSRPINIGSEQPKQTQSNERFNHDKESREKSFQSRNQEGRSYDIYRRDDQLPEGQTTRRLQRR